MHRQLIKSMSKWTALYVRLSRDDENEGDSNSISHQETICQGVFLQKEQIHNLATAGQFQ